MDMQIYVKVFVMFYVIKQHLYLVSTIKFSKISLKKKRFKRGLNIPMEDRSDLQRALSTRQPAGKDCSRASLKQQSPEHFALQPPWIITV